MLSSPRCGICARAAVREWLEPTSSWPTETWPWCVAGPLIGLFVPALPITGNKVLGIAGGCNSGHAISGLANGCHGRHGDDLCS
jgi:hypothetical protein